MNLKRSFIILALGIWWNKDGDKKYYVDVSVAVEDRKLAEYLGKEFNQKAIWGFQEARDTDGNGNIDTGGSGEPVEHPLPEADRLRRALEEYARRNPPLKNTKNRSKLLR